MSEQHLALYRKYRPQTFSDVVGQEHLVTLLESSIKQKKISHAYLFCGGRGTGKTTVARIFAHDIGCNPEDIIEIDAASNRGIDEIRELRDAVRTAPFSSQYKVYIVDEAHMLTKEAANALLKTLEEPPSHVIFILATTDQEKLPATIVSRCQKVEFKSPDMETLSKRIKNIAEREGNKSFDIETAKIIASQANGSFRDALGRLESFLIVGKTDLSPTNAKEVFGTPDSELIVSLIKSICEKDSHKIATMAGELEKNNRFALTQYDYLLNSIRCALLIRVGAMELVSKSQSSHQDELGKLAKDYPLVIGSKLILQLLEKRHLLEVSESHAWTAFLAVMLSTAEPAS